MKVCCSWPVNRPIKFYIHKKEGKNYLYWTGKQFSFQPALLAYFSTREAAEKTLETLKQEKIHAGP